MLIVKSLSGGDQHASSDTATPTGGGASSRATPGPSKKPGKVTAGRGTEKPEPSYVDQLV